jgi:hypothetical protein
MIAAHALARAACGTKSGLQAHPLLFVSRFFLSATHRQNPKSLHRVKASTAVVVLLYGSNSFELMRQIFFEFRTAPFQCHHLRCQIDDSIGRVFNLNATCVNVGNEIPVGIGVS